MTKSKSTNWLEATLFLAVVFCIFWVIGWFGYHMYAEKSIGVQLKGQRYINDMAKSMGIVFGSIAAIYTAIKKPWKS